MTVTDEARAIIDACIVELSGLPDYAGRPAWDEVVRKHLEAALSLAAPAPEDALAAERHDRAQRGPCSDKGDGCTCSDAELARRAAPEDGAGETWTQGHIDEARQKAAALISALADEPGGVPMHDLPGVDVQVCTDIALDRLRYPAHAEWVWLDEEERHITLGRWPRSAGQVAYIRGDIAMSSGFPAPPPSTVRAEALETLDRLRAEGWCVAVHNDYRLGGEPHTFWLFTKDGRAIKGEGRTDAEALAQIAAAIREAAKP